MKSPHTVNVIKVCTMEWLGNVVRKKESNEVTGGQTRRREKRGRPRLNRMDDVELDLKNMGVRRGRTRTLDRT